MYLLTRKNRIIHYCATGYHYVGNVVVCPDMGCSFEDATIVYTDKELPLDIDTFQYDYIQGEFIKSHLVTPIIEGGTGADNAAKARENLGINLENLGINANSEELSYLAGATSNIQSQINVANDDIDNLRESINSTSETLSTVKNDLSSHTSNTSNPHGVTKSQVGLGNVPNVATNNQTPTYSQASTLATLASGEKLSVSFGKIMKAITDLISHIGNKTNPHGVTADQVGASATGHKHAASDINSGTLDAARIPDLNASKITAGTVATARLPIVVGSSTFAGNSSAKTISSSVPSNTSYKVIITPTHNSGGKIGEYWVTKASGSFSVYNTGSSTGSFDYIIYKS